MPDAFQDTLGDSRPSTATSEILSWDQSAGATFASTETLVFTWPAGFGGISSITAADVTWTDNAVSKTISMTACPAANLNLAVSSNAITLTACASYSGTAGSIILVTLNGTNKITNNSTPAVYTITGASSDDGTQITDIVIVAGAVLSTTITSSLTFTVGGLTPPAIGTCATSGGTYSLANSTATTMPFTASPITYDTFYDSCQLLTTSTNGSGGYNTTVQTASTFASGSDTIAKGTCDGGCSDTTTATWATAAAHTGFAYCMKDSGGTTAAATADGTGWAAAKQCGGGSQGFKTFPNANLSQTAQPIMKSTTAIANSDTSYFSMRLTIPVNQAAGTYTATIIYICTPMF